MIRILFFLIVVFALGLGFAWLADRPGDMVVTFERLPVPGVADGRRGRRHGGRRRGDDPVVAGQGDLEQPLHDLALLPRAPPRPRLPGAVDRHDRGRRRRRRARPQDEQAGGEADQLGDRAADPASRRAGVAARRRSRDGARQVRGDARRSRDAAARPARALSRGRAARRPHGRAPLCRPRGRGCAASRLGGQRDHRGAHRARRLGRRAEAGREPEGDAADRARRGEPPPRGAAHGQGAGAVRHRSGRLAQRRARGEQAAAGLRAGGGRRRQGAVQAERSAQGRQDPRGCVARGRRIPMSARSMSMRGRATPSTTG